MDHLELATSIIKKLVRNGYTAYFAGGWVRDYILKRKSDDIDIATNAPPDIILDLFPRTLLVGLNFGVVIVAMNGHQFEVSTFRKDINYQDGRRPERIELASAEEDALRRDFTINGMFYDPLENLIHDFVGGMEDIQKRVIRTIGNPHERFYEDRLRMIRAFRFASRFGFTVDNETQEAIRENAQKLFPSVAVERIWQEFNKMASYPGFEIALTEMHRLDILAVIFPSLKGLHLKELKSRVEPLKYYPVEYPTILFLLELFPNDSLEALLQTCKMLKTSTKDQDLLEFFYISKKKFLNVSPETLKASDWAKFYAQLDSSLFLEVAKASLDEKGAQLFLAEHQARQETLSSHIQRIRYKKPLITAEDLKAEGIPQSKELGKLLKEAEEISINNNIESSEELMKLLKQTPFWPV